jgi:hypothetical protein
MKKFLAALLLGMAVLSVTAMAATQVVVAGVTIPAWWEAMDAGDTVASGAYNVITASADCEFEEKEVSSEMKFETDNSYAKLKNELETDIDGKSVGVAKQFTSQSGSALVQTSTPYKFDAQKSQSQVTDYAGYEKSQMALFSGMLVEDKGCWDSDFYDRQGDGNSNCDECGKSESQCRCGHYSDKDPAFEVTFDDCALVGVVDDWNCYDQDEGLFVNGKTEDAKVKISIDDGNDVFEDCCNNFLYEAYGAQSSSASVTKTLMNIKGAGCAEELVTLDGEAGLLGGFKGAVVEQCVDVEVELDGGDNEFWWDDDENL